MPGSPARRITEAGTRPPPRTRSTPARPVRTRESERSEMERGVTAGAAPPPDGPPGLVEAVRSAIDPHAPQPGHRPAHCAISWPHSAHSQTDLTPTRPTPPPRTRGV